MSERMTDEELVKRILDANRNADEIVLLLAKAAHSARRVELEQAEALKAKDATIKALADALADVLSPERCFGCWCPASRDVERAGHQPPCERTRVALRLAGRLP